MKYTKLLSTFIMVIFFINIFSIPILAITQNSTETPTSIFITDENNNPISNAKITIYKEANGIKSKIKSGFANDNGIFDTTLTNGKSYILEGENTNGTLFGKALFFIEEGYIRTVLVNLVLKATDFINKGINAGNNLLIIAGIVTGSIIILFIAIIVRRERD